MPTRRRFLAAVPAVAVGARLTAADRVPVVDTHLHCFAGKDDARFPYHPDGPYQPAEPATPEHLLRCMAEGGVDYAVVVHPEPYQYGSALDSLRAVRGVGVVSCRSRAGDAHDGARVAGGDRPNLTYPVSARSIE